MTGESFKLQGLADAADVTPRTVRYYIAQGLMPSPGRLGANTRYGREHLERLRLIRSLQDEGLPLAEIRDRVTDQLAMMSAPMLAEASPRPLAPMLRRVSNDPSALEPPNAAAGRSSWDRIVLAPGIELHLQRPASPDTLSMVDTILALAGHRA